MKKVLVINNDFDFMILLKNWLEKRTYKVKYTGNVEEVPQIMEEFRPELIIADIIQSRAVEQINLQKKNRPVPILLMTGYTSKPVNTPLQVDDVIEKPFNLPLLERKIENLMRKSA